MFNANYFLKELVDLLDEYNTNSLYYNLCETVINEKISYGYTDLLEEEYKKQRQYKMNMLDIGRKIYEKISDLDDCEKKLNLNNLGELELKFFQACFKRFYCLAFEIGMSSYGGLDLNINNYSNGYNECILYKHASNILTQIILNKEIVLEDKGKYQTYIEYMINYFNDGKVDVKELRDFLNTTNDLIYKQDLLDILKISETKELSRR